MNMHVNSSVKAAAVVILALFSTANYAQEPMIGEVRFFAGNFAPRGWALCDGQLLDISQNQALFSILGTTYGGDGRTNFALPDMRGRSPVHAGTGPGLSNKRLGENGGTENLTLGVQNMPSHSHTVTVSASSGQADSTSVGHLANPTPPLAQSPTSKGYASNPSEGQQSPLAGVSATNTGGSQAFNHRNPFVTLNCIIALTGTFPSRN